MGFEISLLAAFAAMLCWGFGDFFIQRSVRRVGDVQALAWIGVIGVIGLAPFIIKDLPLLANAYGLSILLILGVITFIAAIVSFEAYKKGKLSVVEVLLELELPITVILGMMFFRESPSVIQFGIMGLIFLGIILMAIKKPNFKEPFKGLEKGVWFAVLGAIGMGLLNFFTASGAKNVSPLMAVWVPWVVFTVISLAFIARREGLGGFVSGGLKHKGILLAMGIFDTLAWLFYAFAVMGNELSITTAITESYPAIGLFLGLWFNGERIKKHQYLGAGIAIICSILLAFFIP